MPRQIEKLCPHCGRNMAAYPVRITPGILGGLRKLIHHVRMTGVNDCHLKDAGFNTNEITNISKLRFHGLVG